MQVQYLVEIPDPHTHMVKISLYAKRNKDQMTFFLPSWSPGSYLMREYARHLRTISAKDKKGKDLFIDQVAKGKWQVDFSHHEFKSDSDELTISYEIYAHELTVRTSHIDDSHAFLHGPSLFLGIEGEQLTKPTVELRFPPLWSKVTTGLIDISKNDKTFLYEAIDYDDLLDCPIEIGCQETDGFMVDKKEHYLAFWGETYPHSYNVKADMKKIVEYVSKFMGDIPYENYTFITHFAPNLFGGLEHQNSTALHFDGRLFNKREAYIQWLALVAHEYFHTWNIKRIRPKELGPFDYTNENYTKMLWLAEGLTSFVDELFVYQSGLCTLEEYLKMQKDNLNRYYSIPGRKFHSLETSSYNAWIKLYRPDENTLNSSISYYLKGGIVFNCLHIELLAHGKTIQDLCHALWKRYKEDKKTGMTKKEFLDVVTNLSNKEVAEKFEHMLSSTEEIDYESYFKKVGVSFKWEPANKPSFGVTWEPRGDRVFIKSVTLDSAAHQNGLNAADELIAINRQRFLFADTTKIDELLKENTSYLLTISRLGKLIEIEVTPKKPEKTISQLVIEDRKLVENSLLCKS